MTDLKSMKMKIICMNYLINSLRFIYFHPSERFFHKNFEITFQRFFEVLIYLFLIDSSVNAWVSKGLSFYVQWDSDSL